jgi:polysaccharide pyruvyl transferase WcaK-like protein
VKQKFGIETLPIRHSAFLTGMPRKLNRCLLKIPGKLFDFAQALNVIRTADVMIIPGTGILDDFGERLLGMPFDIFNWCLAARIVGTRLAFVSIGAGPIGRPLNRLLMTAAARLAHYRSYRDTVSKTFMDSVGFDTTRDAIYPDIVFRLTAPSAMVPRHRSGALTVGVGVMTYRGWYDFAEEGQSIFDRYIGKLTQFVVYLLDNGYNVRLLTGETGDQTALDALLGEVRKVRPNLAEATLVAEPAHSLHDLMRQMSPTDIVVATRFHNIVCALKVGKPTISLGYAAKNDVLMAEMGLGDYCQHVERFDVKALIAQFCRLVATRHDHAQTIRKRNREFEAQLDRQGKNLLTTLL